MTDRAMNWLSEKSMPKCRGGWFEMNDSYIYNLISEVVDKEISESRAIEIGNIEWWNHATDLQIAYIQLHQKRLICDFHKFHQACEKVIDSPIQSMSFGIQVLVDKLTEMVDEKFDAAAGTK